MKNMQNSFSLSSKPSMHDTFIWYMRRKFNVMFAKQQKSNSPTLSHRPESLWEEASGRSEHVQLVSVHGSTTSRTHGDKCPRAVW